MCCYGNSLMPQPYLLELTIHGIILTDMAESLILSEMVNLKFSQTI